MKKPRRRSHPMISACLDAWKELDRALNNQDEGNDSVRDAAVDLRDAFWNYMQEVLEVADKREGKS